MSRLVLAAFLVGTFLTSTTLARYCDGIPEGTLINWHDVALCNRFYACQHGVDHEWFCPPGQFFSQRNQQCEATCNVIDRQQWCAGLPDGTFIRIPPGEPADCNRYYTCMAGVMHPQACPPGFWFSQQLQMCVVDQSQC
ncbi:hypothetical protein pipiens_009473 [Culex pipiens pipiens]|uniref:Chitin-binding type-2 domain-containing protein n=2 Tax=Culex pipiens TaxID=7175 RepID=A0ABD1DEU7_CULPP